MIGVKEYLKTVPYMKKEVDLFLNEEEDNWAYFDSEVGYLLKSAFKKDGIDDSYTIASYEAEGYRKMVHYSHEPCRINTYGNSFTQCHQVSDGETWQGYLAAHFGEPIRNYGIGGHGVFQAFTRMKRNEISEETGAEYVILNIFSDDHFRNIDSWRWIRIEPFRDEIRQVDPNYFHANPWRHLRINEKNGQFEEKENRWLGQKDDLYKLCDADYVTQVLEKDLIVHLEIAKQNGDFDREILMNAASVLGLDCDFSTEEATRQTAMNIHDTYALKSSIYLIERIETFLKERGKKLMIFLTYGANEVEAFCDTGYRFDGVFVDYLKKKGLNFVDGLELHKTDYQSFSISPGAYRERYFVHGFGHYTPSGNHFFAFGVKDALLKWLDSPPKTYKAKLEEESSSNAASYLA